MELDTVEDLVSWGKTEDNVRKAEIDAVDSEAALKRVQAACRARRLAVGLTAGQATKCIRAAQLVKKHGWSADTAWNFGR